MKIKILLSNESWILLEGPPGGARQISFGRREVTESVGILDADSAAVLAVALTGGTLEFR